MLENRLIVGKFRKIAPLVYGSIMGYQVAFCFTYEVL
jgi:hypothetical protein